MSLPLPPLMVAGTRTMRVPPFFCIAKKSSPPLRFTERLLTFVLANVETTPLSLTMIDVESCCAVIESALLVPLIFSTPLLSDTLSRRRRSSVS